MMANIKSNNPTIISFCNAGGGLWSTAHDYLRFVRMLLGDGSVVLLDASGHTAGSLAAWVAAGTDGVLLTGDAAWTEANWALPARQWYAWDEALHWRRLWQIREWKRAQPRLLVLCGHDAGPLRREAVAGVFLHE